MPVVPEISRFFGIVIAMYRREHAPPHLHAKYGDYEISLVIETGEVRGRFPRSALRLVREWTHLHRAELMECWRLASDDRPFGRIEPLE
jgi:hypothetical protein